MPRLRPALLCSLLAVLPACGDAPPALTGTWLPADAADARYTFFADGRARIVMHAPTADPGGGTAPDDAPQVYEARYDLAGDTLLTLADEQGSERFRVRLDGDTLHLASPATGRTTRLVRAR